jgi:hypothetical protein
LSERAELINIATKIAELAFQNLEKLPTDTLIDRINMTLEFLGYEYTYLNKKHRYTPFDWTSEDESLFIKVINEIQLRLE